MELLVVIAIIVALAAIATPMAFKQLKKAAMTQALSNGKQIGQALVSFDQDFGRFPDDQTGQQLQADGLGSGFTGSSNGYFRQLIVTSTVDTEVIFFAKINGTVKPDGNIQGINAIANRECGFSYVMRQGGTGPGGGGGLQGLSTASNSQVPAVMTPTIGNSNRFDPEPFDNRAIVVRINNQGETLTMRQNGTVGNLFPINTQGIDLATQHQIIAPQL